ncbi:hypothetical protein GIB67_008677 [Kingdonia uniflora]|uniref:Endonuclease/exonuclease/phosphatase domain-containing protein n=1 Tax=Kingdonia uniflora TaxID=39325 RepID=A0A7J7M515_9MAGN|nr:hypothetical protein GIB67_008677 [Kingdonia uniflora]
MLPLRNFKDHLNLRDLKWKGLAHTWSNYQVGVDKIFTKLDIILVNSLWINEFMGSEANFLPFGISDHSPIHITLISELPKGVAPFRFSNIWAEQPSFKEVVEKTWETRIFGPPMYVLTQELKIFKADIRVWKKENFGYSQIEEVREKLKMVPAPSPDTGSAVTLPVSGLVILSAVLVSLFALAKNLYNNIIVDASVESIELPGSCLVKRKRCLADTISASNTTSSTIVPTVDDIQQSNSLYAHNMPNDNQSTEKHHVKRKKQGHMIFPTVIWFVNSTKEARLMRRSILAQRRNRQLNNLSHTTLDNFQHSHRLLDGNMAVINHTTENRRLGQQLIDEQRKNKFIYYVGNTSCCNESVGENIRQPINQSITRCLPTLAIIPVWIGLYRALSNVANEGLLTEGFFWIPSLAGSTTIAAKQSGSGISWLFPFVALCFVHLLIIFHITTGLESNEGDRVIPVFMSYLRTENKDRIDVKEDTLDNQEGPVDENRVFKTKAMFEHSLKHLKSVVDRESFHDPYLGL